jgi:hypothetical protein
MLFTAIAVVACAHIFKRVLSNWESRTRQGRAGPLHLPLHLPYLMCFAFYRVFLVLANGAIGLAASPVRPEHCSIHTAATFSTCYNVYQFCRAEECGAIVTHLHMYCCCWAVLSGRLSIHGITKSADPDVNDG